MKIKRGIGIMIAGALMFLVGHFLSQLVLESIPTVNPANSSLITDANYHMISWSNQLTVVSQFGIIALVIGAFVFFIDRKRTSLEQG
jgi:large-conductance mechanosensitive channel